jgi:fused signal recognition particle receptor
MNDSSWWMIAVGVLVLVALVGWAVARRRRRPGGPAGTELPAAPTPGLEERPRNRLLAALSRTAEAFRGVFGHARLDDAAIDALEEALIRADVGAVTAGRLIAELRRRVPAGAPPGDVRAALRAIVHERVSRGHHALAPAPAEGPLVILVVGVNGSGKTTTIGKLAARYGREGRSVVLGAGDTFRAGAIEQLKVWGERAGAPVIAHQEGADPAAVLHDTLSSAVARGTNVAICDTAGRLQVQRTLMDELAKVRRVVAKVVPGAPHEVLLVLDATMGQNALSQARLFKDVAGVTGIALTKLDGTAKGGVVIAVAEEFGLPVKLVGLGEKVDDLRDFEPDAFVDALFPEDP